MFSRKRGSIPYEAAAYRFDGSTQFVQWWYFDADFDSGHRLMVNMMPRAFGEIENDRNGPDPGIAITLTTPDLRRHGSRAYYSGAFQGDPARMRVAFAENTAECRHGRYYLSVRQGGIGCELEYTPLLPPWPPLPGSGGFMARPLVCLSQMSMDTRRFFHYASMIPRAKVTGRLILPDGEVPVQGEGYHEQGRTNAPLQKTFSTWYWTRFFIDDWTFIFPAGMSPRRTGHMKMRALAIYHRDRMVADLFDVTGLILQSRVTRFASRSDSGRDDIPLEAVFSARWPGLRLNVEMRCFHERECFRFIPFGVEVPGSPIWLQYLMEVKVSLRLSGTTVDLTGQGIFETMITGAA